MASNRERIKEMIEAGNNTKEAILEEVGCTINSFRTTLATLRLMGYCAVTDDDGVLTFVGPEEWERMKAERAEKAKSRSVSKLTPKQRYDRAVKAVARCAKAAENALKRAEDNEDESMQRELDLRAQKAAIELELANIVFNRTPEVTEEETAEEPVEDQPVEAPEVLE